MASGASPNSVFLLGAALGFLLVGCQGSDLTLPSDGSPFHLKILAGNGQQGRVGSDLPRPLAVQVFDRADRKLADVSLRFETRVPGARVLPAEVLTNDTGYAEVQVRLGSTEGTQVFEALLADAAVTGPRATFLLIAVANPPDNDDDADDDGQGEEGDDDHGQGDNGDDGDRGNGGGDDGGRKAGKGGHGNGDEDDRGRGGHGHGHDKDDDGDDDDHGHHGHDKDHHEHDDDDD